MMPGEHRRAGWDDLCMRGRRQDDSAARQSDPSATSPPRSVPTSRAGTSAAPLRLDQDRRPDPQQDHPQEHLKRRRT